MNNKEIAKKFQLLGKLMELHGENQFKTRSYSSAYLTLRKWPDALFEMDAEQLSQIPGVGRAIQDKIIELKSSGSMATLDKYLDMTPDGIVDMLQIKGFGPKKVLTVWKDLGVESAGELLYAVQENRLLDLKGFGKKSQESLKIQLEYHLESAGKVQFAQADEIGKVLKAVLEDKFTSDQIEFTGAFHRKENIIEKIDIITTADSIQVINVISQLEDASGEGEDLKYSGLPIDVIVVKDEEFQREWFKSSCGNQFYDVAMQQNDIDSLMNPESPSFIIPEYRENDNAERISSYPRKDQIITVDDIKGCVHNHTTYSDGMNTLEEMVAYSESLGHEYFVLTDHSRSAFYANGLQIERLYQQLDEVRDLDQQMGEYRIFSGIESDILANGDLDYPDDVLAELDVVIASVHSNLKMDEAKATARLLNAIENPYTSILGHPTGRLLLSRPGYPIDHKKIIDACAANNVAIEINASPYRLDIDWRWIDYCMEQDVLISINPDAHSTSGIDDIYYGVCSARKAALLKSFTLNAMDTEEFEEWLVEQHEKR